MTLARNLACFVALSSILIFASAFSLGSSSYSSRVGAPEIIIPSFHATATKNSIMPAGSTNWAGYVVKAPPGKISNVKMSWIVPAVSCSVLMQTYGVVWVGIDGAGTNTVEQIGTGSNCGLLGATYY